MSKSKRDIVIETIEAGNATMETLMEAADCKYESIMSIFSTLRLMGRCPVKDVDITLDNGTVTQGYRFVSLEEWESIKAERAANAKTASASTKTPEERFDAAKKRLDRCDKAREGAQTRADKDPENEELELRAQKAAIEYRLAEIDFDAAKLALGDPAPSLESDESDEPVELEE